LLVDASASQRWLTWLPRAGRIARQARTASLAELLGLLVEHGVPLPEAVRLAGGCCGGGRLQRSADQVAAAIEQGAAIDASAEPAAALGPSIAWLLASGWDQRTFVARARHVAATQRSRLALEITWLREYLPIVLSITVGGAVVALLAVALFLPFTHLMEAISQSTQGSMGIR
jgi:type II secretory pathway component PulF